jgi:hypothetical protein
MDLRQAHFPLLDRHFRASRAEQSHHHRLNHERSRLGVLHQIREGEESGQERIVLGILNLDSGGLPIRSEVIAGVKSRLNNW